MNKMKMMEALEQKRLMLIAVTLALIVLALLSRTSLVLEVDGQVMAVSHYFPTDVADILRRNQITLGSKDILNVALHDPVHSDARIIVQRAFSVFITADGEKREIVTAPLTVAEAVELSGFVVGEKDVLSVPADSIVEANGDISIIRVTEEIITEDRVLRFATENTVDDSLEKGLSRTVQAGENGLAADTVKVIYYDGEEYQRELVSTDIKQSPRNKVVAMGTITSVSRGGIRLDFRTALDVRATAYTYTGHRTATGRNPAVGLVAVDPTIIPLGSKLYIEGYGYAEAADTGGAIKGNRIDLFMESREECVRWGNRSARVYVLN
jgi:uncharacterized protein YabE (DUF348 family)/3D (Asp-Asp-Asp) domain-containing protein